MVHIHLAITHLPVFGTIIGSFVLAFGLWKKSKSTVLASYMIFLMSAIGAVIAASTGEAAEEAVEKIQGVMKNAIEAHENFAGYSFTAMLLLGVSAIVGIFCEIKQNQFSKMLAISTLVISLVSFGLIANTASLGGKIRHTELNSTTATQTFQENSGEHEDHD